MHAFARLFAALGLVAPFTSPAVARIVCDRLMLDGGTNSWQSARRPRQRLRS